MATPAAPVATLMPGETRIPTATPVPAAKVSTAEIKFGGFIPMQQYQANNLRPMHAFGIPSSMTLSPLFSSMVDYDPEQADPSVIRCDLCTSWELADDSVTYTFHLHQSQGGIYMAIYTNTVGFTLALV